MFRCNPVSKFLSHLGEYSSPKTLLICVSLSYVCFPAMYYCTVCVCVLWGALKGSTVEHTGHRHGARDSARWLIVCVNLTGP